MNITERDKRALIGLAVIVVMILAWRAATPSEDTADVQEVTTAESIPASEMRLSRLRQVAASVPAKQEVLDKVSAELGERERGLIQADSAQQAQAQVMQILRRVGRAQQQPIDFKNVELGAVRPFGDQYGEVLVSVSFDSGIEQLLNLLADLTEQKELVATTDLRVGMAHPKQKTLPVRLTVSGLVRRSLVPARRGPGTL